jgi:DNA-binding NtrC family response regulator
MKRSEGRILIVDDEPALLKMMSAYLERLGYQVETSSSTDEAWERVQANPGGYSVAVLDATMPGLSLDELALNILNAAPSIRVLAASGYPVDMTSMEKAAPGRVLFLPKPFTPEMLVTTIRSMLASQEEETL